MLNFINRGIEKIKSFFVFNKQQSEKCRKCSIVKRGVYHLPLFSLREISIMKTVILIVVWIT